MLRWLYIIAGCLLISTSLLSAEQESSPIKVELVSEEGSIQAGHPFWVGIHLKLDKGWHAYWKNPGDAGMPPVIEWTLPPEFSASSPTWPIPEKFINESLVGYGYHGDVLLMAQITPPKDLEKNKDLTLSANVRWLVCSDTLCVPGESQVEIQLPVSINEPKLNQAAVPLFAKTRASWPQKMKVEAHHNQGLIEMHLPLPEHATENVDAVLFFPEEQNSIDQTFDPILSAADSKSNAKLIVKLPEDYETIPSVKGIVALMTKQGNTLHVKHAFEVDTHLQDSDAQAANAEANNPPLEEHGFAMALLLAFIGGMILNLMPCVLPVISFKVMSFVKMAGQKRMAIFKHSLSFAVGVLVSFWILAAVILSLQMYGHAVGWGFQLQEPLFVAFLAALLLVFAFSLFGVYEIGDKVTTWAGKAQTHVSHKHSGYTSSFFSGMLATAVATPCTGPFLGSVVGLAVTTTPLYAMLLFTSMGLGMALPYLLLSLFPKLLSLLPRPGPWMDTFKQLMGFLMLATVLWLVWVFGAQTDNNATILLLISFFLLAVGCWIYGRWGTNLNKAITRFSSIICMTACFIAGGYLIVLAATGVPLETYRSSSGDIAEWEPFSPERIEELKKKGTPVLVDFTAKWCLTCQANRVALTSEDVEKKLADLGVVKMEADWTRNDPVITQELRKHGRNGVPLYLLYSGDPNEPPKVLPQMLTQAVVLEHLKEFDDDSQ